MRDLGPAIAVSLLVHALVIGLVGFTWSSEPELHRAPEIPPYVMAVAMEKKQAEHKTVEKPKPKPAPKPRPRPKPKPKPEVATGKADAAKPKPKPVEKPKPDFKQPSMAEMLAEEELEMEAQKEAAPAPTEQQEPGASAEDQAEVASYEQAIRVAVQNSWILPGTLQAQDGLSVDVSIRTLPGGEVIDASILKSSGYPVLDDSALNAVRKASPLPVPSGGNYEKFRAFTLRMVPQFAKSE